MTTTPREPLHPEETLRVLPHPPTAQGAVFLLLGPVGAGKSTHALELAGKHRAVRLTLDDWMVRLYSPDRPDTGVVEWYQERARRAVAQIWAVTTALVECGVNVVLELGLIVRREREQFYALVRNAHVRLTLVVVDAPRDVRRERVQERNRTRGATFSMHVPDAVFELASDLWEAPDAVELAEWNGERGE
jgi:predicted kinase